MLETAKDYDPEDDEPWSDNPLARLMGQMDDNGPPEPPRQSPKVELTEYNECPCCGGKGFVTVVVEKQVKKKKRGR